MPSLSEMLQFKSVLASTWGTSTRQARVVVVSDREGVHGGDGDDDEEVVVAAVAGADTLRDSSKIWQQVIIARRIRIVRYALP